MQEWFKARNVWGSVILNMDNDADVGRLMKALWQFTMTGEKAELDGELYGIFLMMVAMLEADNAKSENTSKARAIAGSKGGNQRVANQANQANACDEANEANEAIASIKNKNQNKNKNQKENKKKEQEETDALFERFWSVYPRHEAKTVAKAEFEKLKPDEGLLEIMISAIEKQKKSDQWIKEGGQFIPHPRTWLHQKRWEDEVTESKPYTKTVVAQQYSQRDYSEEDEEADRRWYYDEVRKDKEGTGA